MIAVSRYIYPSYTPIRTKHISFGKDDTSPTGPIKPPPPGTPQKFIVRWESLDDCCRNFYYNKAAGKPISCCHGKPEPQPNLMQIDLTRSKKASNLTPTNQAVETKPVSSPKKTSNKHKTIKQHWVSFYQGVISFFKNFWNDLLIILGIRQQKN